MEVHAREAGGHGEVGQVRACASGQEEGRRRAETSRVNWCSILITTALAAAGFAAPARAAPCESAPPSRSAIVFSGIVRSVPRSFPVWSGNPRRPPFISGNLGGRAMKYPTPHFQ